METQRRRRQRRLRLSLRERVLVLHLPPWLEVAGRAWPIQLREGGDRPGEQVSETVRAGGGRGKQNQTREIEREGAGSEKERDKV